MPVIPPDMLITPIAIASLAHNLAHNLAAHAGATQINVVVKEGGNKLLQIQDNGHGVKVACFVQLSLACDRADVQDLICD